MGWKLVGGGYPFGMIFWPPQVYSLPLSASQHLCNTELIISLLLSAKSSYLFFCCHFITGSAYQPVGGHVIKPSLSQRLIFLIRDHHEMGWLVYRGSLMLEKVQSPLKAWPVTFWIIGFFVCMCVFVCAHRWWTASWLSLKVTVAAVPRPEKFTSLTFRCVQCCIPATQGHYIFALNYVF